MTNTLRHNGNNMYKIGRFEYDVDDNQCWNVTNYKPNPDGYVACSFLENGKKKRKQSHRQVWELINGPIPAGKLVCHMCDNRRCVNPFHLWLGTHADNNKDRSIKNRSAMGELNRNAKLSEADVLEILNNTVNTQKELGVKYGVHQATISKIQLKKKWKHIKVNWKGGDKRNKLTSNDVLKIFNDTTHTQQQLADKYEVYQSTISSIKTGKKWKKVTGGV